MNVGLLACDAVEPLFSCVGLVMAHKCTKLTSKHLNVIMFLKANEWLMDS